MKEKGFVLPIVLGVIALGVLIIWGVVYSQFQSKSTPQPQPTQTPTQQTSEPVKTNVQNLRVDVKFVEGSTVRLREGAFVSFSGENLSGLKRILQNYPNIKIERLFTRSEEDLTEEQRRLESQTNKDMPDLNLWYRLLLPKGVDIQSLLKSLDSLAIVETAYLESPAAPPPAQ